MSAWRSASVRSGGFIFIRVSRVRTASSVRQRWCGEASQVTWTPRALASRDRLDGLRRAEVLEVDAPVLVAGERASRATIVDSQIARDPGDAEQRADLALVHRAACR